MADVGAHSSAGVSQTMARTNGRKVNSNQVKFEIDTNNNYHFNLNKVHRMDTEIQQTNYNKANDDEHASYQPA